jgi:hypothetical protein
VGPDAAFPFAGFPCAFAGAGVAAGADFSPFGFAADAGDVASEAGFFPATGAGFAAGFALATG